MNRVRNPLSSPKGCIKLDFAVFASKSTSVEIRLLQSFFVWKRPEAKSFLYLMVHRQIAGDVLLAKIWAQSGQPLQKTPISTDFVNSASAVRASDRWTLCVTPKSRKAWLKTRIFGYFCVAFHFFVADNHRHFKFGMQIDHSKYNPTHDSVPKGAWSHHVIHFKFQGPKHAYLRINWS